MQCITLIHAQSLDRLKGLKLVRVKCRYPEIPKPKVVFYNYCCFNVLKVATFSFHGDVTLFNTQPLQLLRYWIRPFCVRPIF